MLTITLDPDECEILAVWLLHVSRAIIPTTEDTRTRMQDLKDRILFAFEHQMHSYDFHREDYGNF